MKNTSIIHCFTIDLEDWYHVYPQELWSTREPRLVEPTLWLLNQLAVRGVSATFFVLGYIAERHPDLIKQIAAQGHEIGIHGYDHIPVFKKAPEEFEQDVTWSLDIIQSIVGSRPDLYRAPSFSITENTPWVWPILARNGIRRDSSLFAARRLDGGYKDVPGTSFSFQLDGGFSIHEYPVFPKEIGPVKIPFSGGGYFRALPLRLVLHWIKSSSVSVMFYIHPRDIDPGLPDIPYLGFTRRLMVYYGLRSARTRLTALLDSIPFASIGDVYGKE